jgi:hypothetical protein
MLLCGTRSRLHRSGFDVCVARRQQSAQSGFVPRREGIHHSDPFEAEAVLEIFTKQDVSASGAGDLPQNGVPQLQAMAFGENGGNRQQYARRVDDFERLDPPFGLSPRLVETGEPFAPDYVETFADRLSRQECIARCCSRNHVDGYCMALLIEPIERIDQNVGI